jgi:hypothetical protein
MITRRLLLLTGTTGLLAGAITQRADAAQPTQNDPVAIINAIYTRAAKSKGDGGGGFVIETNAAKAKYLSKSLVALWARADAHTPKGDVGPIDFDPVTNSQDPDVKSFKVAAEKLEADTAVIAVSITGRPRGPSPPTTSSATISYAMTENGRSTISAAPATAKPGRSAPFSPNP